MSGYLVAPLIGWVVAQGIKFIAASLHDGKLQFNWLWKSGGLPSSHSAIITAVTATVYATEGIESPLFALSLAVTLIVLYDSIGVRRAAGINSQAILNLKTKSKQLPDNFKVILGHQPIEMVSGALLGIITGFLVIYPEATSNFQERFNEIWLLVAFIVAVNVLTLMSYKFFKELPTILDDQSAQYAKQSKTK